MCIVHLIKYILGFFFQAVQHHTHTAHPHPTHDPSHTNLPHHTHSHEHNEHGLSTFYFDANTVSVFNLPGF